MTSGEIREKYLEFFEKRGHKTISPAPLVLENDPTTLFNSSGMQQFVPYLKGDSHPKGKRLVDSQPCIRTVDIDEVGNSRHLTFFEMLGNWSLGDYFKKEQLAWCWEFFTKELGLSKEKLYVSVFEGTPDVPRDIKSYEIWKSLGIPGDHIFYYGVEKNWWSRSGTPDEMPEDEIGGPDSEIFYEFDSVKHNEIFGKQCHPNCDCGRFFEIGNSVFIQYKKKLDGSLEELIQKNVDFGGGLERIAAALNNDPDIFKTDIFSPIVGKLEKLTEKSYEDNKKAMRIIADHMRASSALSDNGVVPSNKMQGYVLRRLIRRMAVKLKSLDMVVTENNMKELTTQRVIIDEVLKFENTLKKGLKEVEKINKIDGKRAFDLYQSYGFPLELTIELFAEKGQIVDKEEFRKEFEKHKELSRTASAGMFKGGLVDDSEKVTKLHTVTHLLHASLRKILGEGVRQKGSNITKERLRFDFSCDSKLSIEEMKKVEDMINRQIETDLPVSFETKNLKEALKEGALAFFTKKYGEEVKVYTIGPTSHKASRGALPFSREVCGGPHVKRTGEIGRVRIIKQEKIGSGVIRIYLTL